ncbi:M48 family metallopeptidase [Mucilaginibacter achroorhodeus]|uniref:M48 family metallopeptidase n=1 Tax=Mucilaginibacter achroorhodeus TaxID=2599294 RepID=A0A563TWU6_9SPHI|nr:MULTISPECIES: M48 family metallopeptidase [Mucilaginibacter]QXV65200.1 M48 family metallopeptidase [Mucilaginibacter sp. 21P]TWR23825.1 M48 family metallopeptidase [Mucilaginibacter achroorhodeus]
MKNLKLTLAAAITAVGLYACSTVPLTGRSQLSLVSDSEVNPAAAASYRQLLSDPKTKVVSSGSDAQRVKAIGGRLANAIERYLQQNGYADKYQFAWEFNLIQSPEVNAWCMPGGKVAVYSGILPVTRTDAGLAVVMGHEIGHAIARHSAERLSQQLALQTGGAVVGAATGNQSSTTQTAINTLYGVGGQLALLKYSRAQESEADRLGLTFMAMAGYNPNEAVAFWQRMAAQSKGGAQPEFLSTHPSDATRIANIQRLIPEAMKYYKP